MKRFYGLTVVLTAGLSVATAGAAEPERIRGTVTAISPGEVTVTTATGKSILQAGSDTKYLTVVRSDLGHIAAGSYLGRQNVGEKQVALDVLIFPPAMKGAAEGHFGWDRMPDTTLAGGARRTSSMTNGSVATAASSMTNSSVASASEGGANRQVTLTYKGGQQTILVPPTAPVVTLQPGTDSDLKPVTRCSSTPSSMAQDCRRPVLVGSPAFCPADSTAVSASDHAWPSARDMEHPSRASAAGPVILGRCGLQRRQA
jgi:hypothetical protein